MPSGIKEQYSLTDALRSGYVYIPADKKRLNLPDIKNKSASDDQHPAGFS